VGLFDPGKQKVHIFELSFPCLDIHHRMCNVFVCFILLGACSVAEWQRFASFGRGFCS
jgi:hypothetical protein